MNRADTEAFIQAVAQAGVAKSMGTRRFRELIELFHSEFGAGWLNNEFDQQGLIYDLERALANFHGTCFVQSDDMSGQIMCRLEPAERFDTLSQLNVCFYRIWGELAERFAYVERRIEGAEIHYLFLTGSETHGHSGAIVFCGDAVRHLTSKYSVDHQPASMLRDPAEESSEKRSSSEPVD